MANQPAEKMTITDEQVRDFLQKNPDFLEKNADVINDMTPPERELDDGIIDFQHFMVKNLQAGSKDLQDKYDLLVEYCRDNMSVQTQVHNAVLRLIRTRNIEQLLEVIAMDLVSLFDVDVVRLAMESDIRFDTSYGEQSFSGIVFIDPGMIDAAIGHDKNVLLVSDCEATPPVGMEQIFSDCEDMIESCALLKLEMTTIDRNIILAFGIRHKDRFHASQGIELLNFLAQIVAHQLDLYLADLTE